MMSLMEAALATGGTALHGNPRIEGVSTDSRTIASGELFVALKGENFDGHAFVEAAAARGAAAAMVEREWADAHAPGLPLLAVADTRLALGALGAWWRGRFELPLIGVTGSNGKTTVKEMTAAILRAQARSDGLDPALAVLATQGNLNNDIGLPQMLLRLHASHRAAVIEMGMNHPGEIAYLTRLAQPTVALVNNAQRAHLAGLGGVAEVARAKGEIFEGLREGGTAVINADDAFAGLWREMSAGRRTLTFGLEQPADVCGRAEAKAFGSALAIETPQGTAEMTLRVPGLHNARNALAAAAAALAAGASLGAVSAGLTSFVGVKGRLQVRPAEGGAVLIDDSYNANPDSVRAAIDVLAATPGRKVLVLGDMGEIGGQAGQFHDEVGGYAKSQGVDQLFALGEHSELASRNFGAGGQHFGGAEALLAALRPQLDGDTVVLVKGSRFMRMERVADAVADDGKSGNGVH
ncbi:MAG: UDP-N-acetylmuramoyl-tripeptide--D-alanyl-D-alanine ligase [Rhodocyclaceae bacterium]|nr:UDP-N-acetylmuramoyl-tripeptide--D-alanyl-D-alanine ligase [Rhodocyclaceae bacterium]MCQ3924001.1 UDP-N-acetylmuramoyl-tripeptide--D-alanyl-D-alanine ligase [Rhodocyclaceae bacterium]